MDSKDAKYTMESGHTTFGFFYRESLLGPQFRGYGPIPVNIWGSMKWAERFLLQPWEEKAFSKSDFLWDQFIWNLAVKTIFHYDPSHFLYVKHYAEMMEYPPADLLFGFNNVPQRCKHLVDIPVIGSVETTSFDEESRAAMHVLAGRFVTVMQMLDRKACLGKLNASLLLAQAVADPYFRDEFSSEPGALSSAFIRTLDKLI